MSEENSPVDPFDPQQAIGLILIQQLRIYDVMLALLRNENAPMHDKLLEMHTEGKLYGPLPVVNMGPEDFASDDE